MGEENPLLVDRQKYFVSRNPGESPSLPKKKNSVFHQFHRKRSIVFFNGTQS